jgi:DNA invertase Pin-like site-specific DNA recombinase
LIFWWYECAFSLIAQSGLQFDLSTSQGKLIASVMAVLAEFERDLLPNVSVRESQRRELRGVLCP